ncbi:MAG: PP2C family protein-serine/threonine phosphatase [Candidatus Margulisbacteria bacterium]|nr:PP2C family protein-serine/threonine phosphatase [Candidatus Margulisiibacteriota bacterium]
MIGNLLEDIHHLKNQVEQSKSEEDLASVILKFLNDRMMITPLTAFLTINEFNRAVLYGISEYPAELLNMAKDKIVERIENATGYSFTSRNIQIYIEEREEKDNLGFMLDKIKVYPMVLDEQLHGAMIVYQDEELPWQTQTYDFAGWMFQERFFVIANKYKILLNKKLEAINEAREMMYSIINLDDMLSILGDIVLKHAKARLGCVLIKEEKTEEFKIKASWNSMEIEPVNSSSEFVMDFPYSVERIYIEGKGCLLDILKKEPKIMKFDSLKVSKTSSHELIDLILPELLVIPLVERGKTVGALILIRTEFKKEKFTNNDISILETIASLASSSIENNKLHEQTLQEQMVKKDLQVAHNIQKSMQAKIEPHLKNFDIAATSVPARAIGGDYYDFFQLDENRLGITMTDIVGKGIPAALIMAFFKGVMQTSVVDDKDPKDMFSKISLNLYLNKSVKNYIPSVYGILDDEKKTFCYANAGHENPLFLDYQTDEFRVLDEGGLPLGAFKDSEYEQEIIHMKEGDIACVFTDGVTEARNIYHQDYGEERFKKFLLKNKHLSAGDLVQKIYEEVFVYSEGLPAHDDFTVMIIKRV